MKKFESQTHYQRFMLGQICGFLPLLCLMFGVFGEIRGTNNPEWYFSISATYFANSNMCMIGSLCLCSFFLFTYKGYDLGDRFYTMVSAISALLIVACPCAATEAEYIGLFALPAKVSDVVHMVSAATLFGSFALMTLTQFTKGNNKRKNAIYRTCGYIMLLFMCFIVLSALCGLPGYMTMICEAGMLEAFAFAWIVKSGAIQIKEM